MMFTEELATRPLATTLPPAIKFLGTADYEATWQAMREFTAARTADTRDEIWLLQHPPTYTQGQAGLPEHLLNARQIPVVKIDRGGQITYHGPGQIVAYLLLDLRRWKINVRELVRLMEQSVIDILAGYNIAAAGRVDAPGVYVGDAKIAALGLKIKHSCCYHGLSFNIDMDLTPYDFINPCGYKGLRVTQLKDFGIDANMDELQLRVAQNLIDGLRQHINSYVKDDPCSPKTAPHPNPLPASGARESDVPSPHEVGRGWSAAEGEGKTTRSDPELEEKLKGYARELRASSSDAEQRIWHLLRDRNFLGYKFRRQHPVVNYILDFYCADMKVAIELDGGQHADNENYDRQRTEILQREGIKVLRFWNNDVLANTEGVLTRIAEVLQNQERPSPQPGPSLRSPR